MFRLKTISTIITVNDRADIIDTTNTPYKLLLEYCFHGVLLVFFFLPLIQIGFELSRSPAALFSPRQSILRYLNIRQKTIFSRSPVAAPRSRDVYDL